ARAERRRGRLRRPRTHLRLSQLTPSSRLLLLGVWCPVVPDVSLFQTHASPRQARVDRGREAMVKMTKLPAHMANQSRLFAAALCVSTLIGAVGSGAAEPLSHSASADAQPEFAPDGPGLDVPA